MFTRRNVMASAAASAACACAAAPRRDIDVATLASQLEGRVILPNTGLYDRARRVSTTNPRVEAHPLAIAQCASEADVARVIAFSRRSGLDLAVRGGGHDMLGASTSNGVVLDLSPLQTIDIDPVARTARVGGGVLAGPLSAAAQQHGLAVVLGCDHRPGVSGVTLGGGLGWLIGRHGAACDNLLAARIVTADGRAVRASRDENRDLLWALKGGGGNFGVVTEFTFAMHPIGEVVQGVIAYAAPQPADFLRFFRDYVAGAGNEIDYELFLLPRPSPTAFLKLCYSGDPANAETVLAPLFAYGPPLAHNVAQGAYSGSVDPSGEVADLLNAAPPAPPRQPDDVPGFVWSGFTAAPFSDGAIDAIAARLAAVAGTRWSFGCGYVVHGNGVVDRETTAWPRQEGAVSFFLANSWRRAQEAGSAMAWVDEARAPLRPYVGPTYPNFLGADEPGLIREAYGDNYLRLRGLKRRWDSDNLFRRNRNIPPA